MVDSDYVDKVLLGEMEPVMIEFKEAFCSYELDYLKSSTDTAKGTRILSYDGGILDYLTTRSELDLYLNGNRYGRYNVESISLTLDEFKRKVKPIQEKARNRLKLAVEDINFKKHLSEYGNIALIELNGDGMVADTDIYCEIRNLANELFKDKAERIKSYIANTKPRK